VTRHTGEPPLTPAHDAPRPTGPGDAPPEVVALARERASARAARHFEEADRLRAQIEAAGWKPVDRGLDWSLEPMHPPDRVADGSPAFGASERVPSRLDEPESSGASLILVVEGEDAPAAAMLRDLVSEGGWDDPQVLAVIAGPPYERPGLTAPGEGVPGLEVVRLSEPAAPGVVLNAALRRCVGRHVVTLAPGIIPEAPLLASVRDALDDPEVAIAGARGLRTSDLRRFAPAPAGSVEALDGSCLGFRREDLRALGPLDEGFTGLRHLAIWWSLKLRDRGLGSPPRRALALDLGRTGTTEDAVEDASGDRAVRRDHYRLIRSFGRRRDLVLDA
jgi:hypothetical protein